MKFLLSLCALCAIAFAQTDATPATADTTQKAIDTIALPSKSDSTASTTPVAVSMPEQATPAPVPDGTTSLTITVQPDSAHIFVDSLDRGTGKVSVTFLGTAPHEIRCTYAGYEAENRRLILRAGATRTESIVLKPIRKRPAAPSEGTTTPASPDIKTLN